MKTIVHFLLFVLVLSLWSGLFFILPEFLDNPCDGIQGFVLLSLHWMLIVMSSFFLLSALASYKIIFAVSYPVFCLLGSMLAFFRYAYKATLTPMLIDASVHNDLGTTLDVISPELIIYVLFNIVLSIGVVWFRWRKINILKGWQLLSISLLFLSLFFLVNPRLKSSILERFPFSVYKNLTLYSRLHIQSSTIRISPDSTLSTNCEDSLDIVFVIGESLRADHLRLNGYHRQTNPFLSHRKNTVSLPNIYSEYTNTNRSLPHILTRADSANINRAFTEKSFISLFSQSGFLCSWVSNQDPADTYNSFINECDTIIYAHPEKSVYNYNEWLDEDLLAHSERLINKKLACNLMVLHTIGSHWYYNNHYSERFKLFYPITKSRIIAQCEPQEIINSYDNTVAYTDFFLNELIKRFENKNAIIIYLSDHGEVLGEEGLWLHAGDHKASKNPACIIWFSERYKSKYPQKIKALEENKNKRYRTDFLYHSILDAGFIPSSSINKQLSIFSE